MKTRDWVTLGVGAGLLYWLAKRQPSTLSGLDDLADLGKKMVLPKPKRTAKGREDEPTPQQLSDALDCIMSEAFTKVLRAWYPDEAIASTMQPGTLEKDIKGVRWMEVLAARGWVADLLQPLLKARSDAEKALGVSGVKTTEKLYRLPYMQPDEGVTLADHLKRVIPLRCVSEGRRNAPDYTAGDQYLAIAWGHMMLKAELSAAIAKKLKELLDQEATKYPDRQGWENVVSVASRAACANAAGVSPRFLALPPVAEFKKVCDSVVVCAGNIADVNFIRLISLPQADAKIAKAQAEGNAADVAVYTKWKADLKTRVGELLGAKGKKGLKGLDGLSGGCLVNPRDSVRKCKRFPPLPEPVGSTVVGPVVNTNACPAPPRLNEPWCANWWATTPAKVSCTTSQYAGQDTGECPSGPNTCYRWWCSDGRATPTPLWMIDKSSAPVVIGTGAGGIPPNFGQA